jgi:hypothetical protein
MVQSIAGSAQETMTVAQITTQPAVKPPNSHAVQIPQGALVLIPLCLACVWAIAAIVSGLPKVTHEKNLALKRHSKIPCRTCQFYSNNPYIRCAIRPTDALTEHAIDCPDYKSSDPPL